MLKMATFMQVQHSGELSQFIYVSIPCFTVRQIRRGERDNLEMISHNASLKHTLGPIIRTVSPRWF